MSADYRNRVVPREVTAAVQERIIQALEERQREEDAKNPPVRPPELDIPIVPYDPLVRMMMREAAAANDEHLRRYGRLPDLKPEHDWEKR